MHKKAIYPMPINCLADRVSKHRSPGNIRQHQPEPEVDCLNQHLTGETGFTWPPHTWFLSCSVQVHN